MRSGGLFTPKGSDTHKHEWKATKKRKHGAIFSLHVCTKHPKPVMRAFDMEIEDRSAEHGSQEFALAQPEMYAYAERLREAGDGRD